MSQTGSQGKFLSSPSSNIFLLSVIYKLMKRLQYSMTTSVDIIKVSQEIIELDGRKYKTFPSTIETQTMKNEEEEEKKNWSR